MAPLTPEQRRTRERVESLIRLAAPALDLMLTVGDRVARLVEPDDVEYYPPQGSVARSGDKATPEGTGD